MPAGVVVGATAAALPALQRSVSQLRVPEIPQISLFPASAACTGCPSPQEILIANDIDPARYNLSVPQQQVQSVPQMTTIPGTSSLVTPQRSQQSQQGGIINFLDTARDVALASPFMKIFAGTSPYGAMMSGLLNFGNAPMSEDRPVGPTWVEREKLNKITTEFNVKASKYTGTSPEIQAYNTYLGKLESEGLLKDGNIKYDPNNAQQVAKIAKLNELETSAGKAFDVIVSQHSDLQRDLDAINAQETRVGQGEYWDREEVKAMTFYPVVGGFEIIGKKVQELADWEEKGLKNVMTNPVVVAAKEKIPIVSPFIIKPNLDRAAEVATAGRWMTTGLIELPLGMGMALPAAEYAWRRPTEFASALIPGTVAMGAGMAREATENPAKFAFTYVAPMVAMSGLGIGATKLQGLRTGRPIAWEDIGYFGGIKEEAMWKYKIPTSETKSPGVIDNFLSGAKTKSSDFLRRVTGDTGEGIPKSPSPGEGGVAISFLDRPLQPSLETVRAGQTTVRDFLSTVSKKSNSYLNRALGMQSDDATIGVIKPGGRNTLEVSRDILSRIETSKVTPSRTGAAIEQYKSPTVAIKGVIKKLNAEGQPAWRKGNVGEDLARLAQTSDSELRGLYKLTRSDISTIRKYSSMRNSEIADDVGWRLAQNDARLQQMRPIDAYKVKAGISSPEEYGMYRITPEEMAIWNKYGQKGLIQNAAARQPPARIEGTKTTGGWEQIQADPSARAATQRAYQASLRLEETIPDNIRVNYESAMQKMNDPELGTHHNRWWNSLNEAERGALRYVEAVRVRNAQRLALQSKGATTSEPTTATSGYETILANTARKSASQKAFESSLRTEEFPEAMRADLENALMKRQSGIATKDLTPAERTAISRYNQVVARNEQRARIIAQREAASQQPPTEFTIPEQYRASYDNAVTKMNDPNYTGMLSGDEASALYNVEKLRYEFELQRGGQQQVRTLTDIQSKTLLSALDKEARLQSLNDAQIRAVTEIQQSPSRLANIARKVASKTKLTEAERLVRDLKLTTEEINLLNQLRREGYLTGTSPEEVAVNLQYGNYKLVDWTYGRSAQKPVLVEELPQDVQAAFNRAVSKLNDPNFKGNLARDEVVALQRVESIRAQNEKLIQASIRETELIKVKELYDSALKKTSEYNRIVSETKLPARSLKTGGVERTSAYNKAVESLQRKLSKYELTADELNAVRTVENEYPALKYITQAELKLLRAIKPEETGSLLKDTSGAIKMEVDMLRRLGGAESRFPVTQEDIVAFAHGSKPTVVENVQQAISNMRAVMNQMSRTDLNLLQSILRKQAMYDGATSQQLADPAFIKHVSFTTDEIAMLKKYSIYSGRTGGTIGDLTTDYTTDYYTSGRVRAQKFIGGKDVESSSGGSGLLQKRTVQQQAAGAQASTQRSRISGQAWMDYLKSKSMPKTSPLAEEKAVVVPPTTVQKTTSAYTYPTAPAAMYAALSPMIAGASSGATLSEQMGLEPAWGISPRNLRRLLFIDDEQLYAQQPLSIVSPIQKPFSIQSPIVSPIIAPMRSRSTSSSLLQGVGTASDIASALSSRQDTLASRFIGGDMAIELGKTPSVGYTPIGVTTPYTSVRPTVSILPAETITPITYQSTEITPSQSVDITPIQIVNPVTTVGPEETTKPAIDTITKQTPETTLKPIITTVPTITPIITPGQTPDIIITHEQLIPPYTPVMITPEVPPIPVPYLPGGGGGGAPSAGGVGYYGFEEFTPMRTPADIVAALMGYGRSKKKKSKKRKLTSPLVMTLDELLGTSTRVSVGSNAFKLDTPIESAIDRAMNAFMSAGKNTKLVPRKQTYNKRGKTAASLRTPRTKKSGVKRSTKKGKKLVPPKKKTGSHRVARNNHQSAMTHASTKYLSSANRKTTKWLGV